MEKESQRREFKTWVSDSQRDVTAVTTEENVLKKKTTYHSSRSRSRSQLRAGCIRIAVPLRQKDVEEDFTGL